MGAELMGSSTNTKGNREFSPGLFAVVCYPVEKEKKVYRFRGFLLMPHKEENLGCFPVWVTPTTRMNLDLIKKFR